MAVQNNAKDGRSEWAEGFLSKAELALRYGFLVGTREQWTRWEGWPRDEAEHLTSMFFDPRPIDFWLLK